MTIPDLPVVPEAERGLVASLLLDNSQASCVRLEVSVDDFYEPRLGVVYGAMLQLLDSGNEVSLVTVVSALKGQPAFDGLGGVPGLVEIMQAEIDGGCASAYARLVRDAADRRRLHGRLVESLRAVSGPAGLPGEALCRAEAIVLGALQARRRVHLQPASCIGPAIIQKAEAVAAGEMVDRVTTGLGDLDGLLGGGFRVGGLYIVAGRTSMGKSALATTIAQHVASRPDGSVLFFTLEIGAGAVLGKMAAAASQVSYSAVDSGTASADELAAWRAAVGRLSTESLIIDDTPVLAASQLRAAARVACQRWGVQLIVVDYIQLVRPDTHHDNRERQVAETSAMLKQVARECRVPVVALSQVSRAAEAGSDPRPKLRHLRESGAIEQDADAVLLLFRPGYYEPAKDTEGQMTELAVAKNRDGRTGDVKLAFFPKCLRFTGVSSRYGVVRAGPSRSASSERTGW